MRTPASSPFQSRQMLQIPDRSTKNFVVPVIAAIALTIAPGTARAFETTAPIAFMVADDGSETVLYAKDAGKRIPPASMSKMMTVYVAFDMMKPRSWCTRRARPPAIPPVQPSPAILSSAARKSA